MKRCAILADEENLALVVQAEYHGGGTAVNQAPGDFAAVRQPEPALGYLPVPDRTGVSSSCCHLGSSSRGMIACRVAGTSPWCRIALIPSAVAAYTNWGMSST